MKKAVLLWVDLEMKGLSPEEDRILEVAAIATGWDLEPIASYTGVVKVDGELIRRRMVGEFWEKNPESYEALVKQNETGKDVGVIEGELMGFIDRNFGKTVYLAGNSIHQDRKFIDREWPEVAGRLHYRMLDVSAWKVYFEGAMGKKFTKPELHRALDDIEGSIEELKYYLSFMKEK
ncbi:oligoribonuclease [Candidatus Saccharibacteria bacterium]|nr:oligoribonuclease [Candidatus Saccharibacteria bacterium]